MISINIFYLLTLFENNLDISNIKLKFIKYKCDGGDDCNYPN